MQGIEILNKTEIMTCPDWVSYLFFGSLIGLGISMLLAIVFSDHKAVSNIFTILTGGCLLIMLSSLMIEIGHEVPTGRYRYDCLIDESVDFIDIYENYEVIEQNGRIWVLEDKK